LEKRFASGLTFLTSYVLSKFLTDAETAFAGASTLSMNHYDRSLEKALSAQDQTHVFKINYSYELPFGPGRKWQNHGPLSQIVGGWQVAGIQNYFSGYPLSVDPGYNLPLFSAVNRITVTDYEGWRAPVKGEKFDPFKDTWWNPAAFTNTVQDQPPSSSSIKGYALRTRFGNATARNPKGRGPWVLDEAISIGRIFKFSESVRMDFRWEAFNLFNRVRWGNPDSTITSPTFGLIRSQANAPRQMQFALKLRF
jgi:hypothetical protein